MKEGIFGVFGLVLGFFILTTIGENTKPSFCRRATLTENPLERSIPTLIHFGEICDGFDFGSLPISIQVIPIVLSMALIGGSGQAIALAILNKLEH